MPICLHAFVAMDARVGAEDVTLSTKATEMSCVKSVLFKLTDTCPAVVFAVTVPVVSVLSTLITDDAPFPTPFTACHAWVNVPITEPVAVTCI